MSESSIFGRAPSAKHCYMIHPSAVGLTMTSDQGLLIFPYSIYWDLQLIQTPFKHYINNDIQYLKNDQQTLENDQDRLFAA